MSWNEVMQLAVSGATLLTALAAVWTIAEVRRQREATYRPRIAFESQTLAVFEKGGFVHVDDADDDTLDEGFGLELKNLGFGAALNVRIRWHVDYDRIVQWIAEDDFDSKFEIDNDHLVRVTSKDSKISMDFACDKNDQLNDLDHISPESSGGKELFIKLPSLLVRLLKILLYLLWCDWSNHSGQSRLSPTEKYSKLPVNVRIEYSDVANRSHQVNCRLYLDLQFMSGNSRPDRNWMDLLTCRLALVS